MSAATTSERRRVVKPAAERRKEIVEAALELFASRGFEETTVQDIAAAAGVAIGTVYLYFPSKEHVLLGIHDAFHRGIHSEFGRVFDEIGARRERGDDVPDTAVIDAVLDVEAAYCLKNKRTLEVIARYTPRPEVAREVLAGDRKFVHAMAESFRKGMTKGHIHTSDPEMTAYLLNAAIGETFTNSIVYGDPPDLDRLVAQAKELFHKALAPRRRLTLPAGVAREP